MNLTLALAYMALIFWLSSRPGNQVGIPEPWDKLVHATAFGVLAWLWYPLTKSPLWAWGIAALYGLSDEIHQGLVPGRARDIQDWIADMVGALIAITLAQRLTSKRP
jgi:VanZ family protein